MAALLGGGGFCVAAARRFDHFPGTAHEGAALLAGGVGADFVKSEDEGDAEAAAAAAAVDRLRRALRRLRTASPRRTRSNLQTTLHCI